MTDPTWRLTRRERHFRDESYCYRDPSCFRDGECFREACEPPADPTPPVDLWTPADPLPVSGLLPEHWYISDQDLWQDAARTVPVALDGDVVGNWGDITANADHVSQAAAGNKPTYRSGAGDLVNGHPVIRFDGIDDAIEGPFTTGGIMNQPNTLFFVCALAVAAVNDGVYRYCYDGDDAANRHSFYTDTVPNPDKWAAYAGTALGSLQVTTASFRIWTILYNGAASIIWRDGINLNVGNAGALAIDGFCIGNRSAAGGGARPWKGDDAEFLLYDANLGDADKNTVGQYLATRYAIVYTDI